MKSHKSPAIIPADGTLRKELLFKLTQPKLKASLALHLKKQGKLPVNRDGFLYCGGSLPVLLVAHMDTVHCTPVKTVCKSGDKRIWMSPEGIGGDDRCGIYIILRLLEKFDCHVLFTEDEETGAVGAHKFAKCGIRPNVNYIIEFDRKGKNDACFYDCDNPEFTTFITSFGFKSEYGTFSDISTVAPELGIAAVNLSSGYYNAHTTHEHVDFDHVESIIDRAKNILSAKSKKFKYIEKKYTYSRNWPHNGSYDSYCRSVYSTRNGWSNMEEYETNEAEEPDVPEPLTTNEDYLVPVYGLVRDEKGILIESDGDYMVDLDGLVYERYSDEIAIYAPELEALTSDYATYPYHMRDAERMTLASWEEMGIE